MCGIVGMVGYMADEQHAISDMIRCMHHRGPDSSGIWRDEGNCIVLGHARLAIVDISETGHQPMISASGQYVLTYNGEIYNHISLQKKIISVDEKRIFRGTSDTEVLLAAIEVFGFETALSMIEGMFAFALYDRKKHKVILARDRMGEKPLYYSLNGQRLVFASELSALSSSKVISTCIDEEAVKLYMQYGYVPEPASIYKGVSKLCPGTYLEFSLACASQTETKYWDVEAVAYEEIRNRRPSDKGEMADNGLEQLLLNSVKDQMVSDAPIGAFLSGGIDSSLIVAMMQAQSESRIKTYTIGFDAHDFNEAEHAKAVAGHIGTDHIEMYISSTDMLNVIPNLGKIYGEPFADASAIPTYLVSNLASSEIKVALSGDGGDELFFGYNRYTFTKKYWSLICNLPMPLRRVLQKLLTSVSPNQWDAVVNGCCSIFKKSGKWTNPGDKIHKGARSLQADSIAELYNNLVIQWQNPGDILDLHALSSPSPSKSCGMIFEGEAIEQLMLQDQMSYLPGNILTKVDRAAMACSLETRVPLLNSEVVRYSWSLGVEEKYRNEKAKWPLRQILYKYVPQELIDRPKAGFTMPLSQWFSNELHDWVQDTVRAGAVTKGGYFSEAGILRVLDDQFRLKKDRTQQLWNILMFQSWLDSSNH